MIEDGPGEGQHLLPVENTAQTVDIDLIGNTMREPERERLSLILNELGTGLAGRGRDLNEVIRRANPALRRPTRCSRSSPARTHARAARGQLGHDPGAAGARPRAGGGAIRHSSNVAGATAERRDDLADDIETLPAFLDELEPTMERLGSLADESTPVLTDLGAQATNINNVVRRLGPFSQAAIPAVESLGEASKTGIPAVTDARPVIPDVRSLANNVLPVGKNLREVLESYRDTGGIERADGLHLLPGGRDQRVRRDRPLPARRADRQPVRDLRRGAGRGLLGELPADPATATAAGQRRARSTRSARTRC